MLAGARAGWWEDGTGWTGARDGRVELLTEHRQREEAGGGLPVGALPALRLAPILRSYPHLIEPQYRGVARTVPSILAD